MSELKHAEQVILTYMCDTSFSQYKSIFLEGIYMYSFNTTIMKKNIQGDFVLSSPVISVNSTLFPLVVFLVCHAACF